MPKQSTKGYFKALASPSCTEEQRQNLLKLIHQYGSPKDYSKAIVLCASLDERKVKLIQKRNQLKEKRLLKKIQKEEEKRQKELAEEERILEAQAKLEQEQNLPIIQEDKSQSPEPPEPEPELEIKEEPKQKGGCFGKTVDVDVDIPAVMHTHLHVEPERKKLEEQALEVKEIKQEPIVLKPPVDKLKCECGSLVLKKNLNKHLKTKKHLKLVALKK